VLPQFLTGDIRDLVLGMSLDEAVVDSKIELYNDLPLILTYGDSTLKLLKDVYWISIIVSQGIIAFLLYLYILFKVFKTSVLNRDTNAGEMVFAMLTLVIILGFFNQVLDQKCLSFFFWLMVSFLINNVRYTGRKIFKNPFKLNTNPLPTHSPK
jgi:FlaA1/EpsC-like NDP-sugar epimerase